MEIYTQNLLSVTVVNDRIQHNFAAIDAAIKNINQRLSELDLGQKDIKQSLQGKAKHLHNIKALVNSQAETLKRHSMILDEMQAEEGTISPIIAEDDYQKSKGEEIAISEEQRVHEVRSTDKITIKRKDKDNLSGTNQEAEHTKKQTAVEIKPKTGKNNLQKTYLNLKERISALERDSDHKQTAITELKLIIDKYKQRELEHHPKKVSLELAKKSNSKKLISENKSRPSIEAQPEIKQESLKQIMNPLQQILDNPGICQPQNGHIPGESNDLLSKQIWNLKEGLLQKIRVIEAQYKESQHRAQNIEKTVDILQRSHQMLKYDFDRTSTSWSKNRSNPTQDRLRSHERLKDTPMTVHEFYEEKMLQLFNEMDQIKKEYFEIQNKLSKEDETPAEYDSNIQKNTNDTKQKVKNGKIVHSLKVDGGEQKKQVALLRKQLSKLREDFQQFAWGVNTTSANEVKTVVIKPNENKEDWKILSTKIYKLKMQLQSGLRELENKIATNNDMVVVLNGLEVGIEECRLLMKRKVEQSDYEKGLKRLESRLNNFILQVYEKENRQMDTDASLIRQPWFCLSCDNEVKSFGNKPQKSPPKEKLMGRKVNPESHMVRRNQNGKLPSVLK